MVNDNSDFGDDNTIVGNVRVPTRMGSRNTIVGATDAQGNSIHNIGTSIGAGAGFDPASVIIGSGAGANLGRKKPKED